MTGRRIGFVFRGLRQEGKKGMLAVCLEQHGFEVSATGDLDVAAGYADILWVQGNINWYPRLRRSLLRIPRDERPKTIFWHTEPLPLPSSSGLRTPLPTLAEVAKILKRDARATDARTNARRLRQMWQQGIPDVIVVSTASRKAYLAEQGIESHFVPVGYNESFGCDLGLVRDIPALFIGIMTDPRHKRAVRYLRRNGVDVMARGDWTHDAGLWGEKRTETINRARVFLALQRNPRELSGVRMILGMASRALVISEPIHQPDPYIPGTHYVSVPLEEMPDAIRYYEEHPDEARKIADAGHRFVTTEHTLDRSVTRIFEAAGLV